MALSNITAYNVGWGDCFLLRFIDNNNLISYLLLDCGSSTECDWETIAEDISNELRSNNCFSISFMLSHLHQDHYTGFNNVYNTIKNRGIILNAFYVNSDPNNKVFITVKRYFKDIPQELFIGIGIGHSLSSLDSSINVIWPPKPITEPYGEYIQQIFPQYFNDNSQGPFIKKYNDGLYNVDFFSIIFEVIGTNNKKYLFAGDSRPQMQVLTITIDSDGKLTADPYRDQISSDILKKKWNTNPPYKMIKMPHHGTVNWPLELIDKDGYILVSWIEQITEKGNIYGDMAVEIKEFPRKISTNWHSNSAPYPLPTDAFKITISITTNNDIISTYDINQKQLIPPISY